jgi:hypothetical protein
MAAYLAGHEGLEQSDHPWLSRENAIENTRRSEFMEAL